MANSDQSTNQNALRNSADLIVVPNDAPDGLRVWMRWYFDHATTATEVSKKAQRRDLELFLKFIERSENTDKRLCWTPRVSESFKALLCEAHDVDGSRHWSDRTINRTLTTMKTFAKFIHSLRPFPLGNPMANMKLLPLTNFLEIERALSTSEHRRLLDAADSLQSTGGKSKSRRRYVKMRIEDKPRRKGYRPYRNRAIIYTLTETGMRRAAVTKINLADVDFEKKNITVEEKGRGRHAYKINKEGLAAIRDYLQGEREVDYEKWQSPALFLSPRTNIPGNGRLSVPVINNVWNAVCKKAEITGRTPHSARHAMGRHIMEQTRNVAAVQRQLGHKNAAYSLQYSRITDKELDVVLERPRKL